MAKRLTAHQKLATYAIDCLVGITPTNLRTSSHKIGVPAWRLRALAALLDAQFPGVLDETRRRVAARITEE